MFFLQGVNKHNGETVAVKTFNQLSHMRPQEVQVSRKCLLSCPILTTGSPVLGLIYHPFLNNIVEHLKLLYDFRDPGTRLVQKGQRSIEC